MTTFTNDKQRAGEYAAKREFFGAHNRYAIAPVHTRFESVMWFVWDAERPDEDGYATVVRQENTRPEALVGLPA